MNEAVSERYAFATQIAHHAGQITLDWFQRPNLAFDCKDDRSPVTDADRSAEQYLRECIESRFPSDGIVGEEFGIVESQNDVRWILDPIDGTKSFISGVPLFGTMVGVEINGNPSIGVIAFPALDEMVHAATGLGTYIKKGNSAPQRALVRGRTSLSDAIFVTSEARTFKNRGAESIYDRLEKECYVTRTWGDAYGYYLVATGRVDIMIDPILSIWDAAAVKPVIEEAGGVFVDWNGIASIDSGDAIGTNKHLLNQILEITRQK